MMKRTLAGFFAFAALAACAYEGPTQQFSVWRGETQYVSFENKFSGEMIAYLKKNPASQDGVALECYNANPVAYANRIHGNTLYGRYDYVTPYVQGCDADQIKPMAGCKIVVSKDAKAGVYKFGPIHIRVVDRVLPPASEWRYFLDLGQHPWAVSRFFDVEPFSKEHYERMAPIWKTLAASGAKALTVTLLDLPWNHQCYDAYHSMIGRTKNDDGTWTFDYSLFDEYVEFGRKCGIGPDIACYTMCPWGYVVRWKNSKGEIQRATAYPGTKIFNEYWGDFLVDFAKHLKEKGWFKDAYIAMDERSPEDVKKIAAFIQEKAPGMKIAMAGNRKPSDFNGIVIDNYSQALQYITPEFLSEIPGRREKGYKTTFYVCCSPARPNSFMTSADSESFYLGLVPALVNMDGFLRWAANSWPHNPYRDATYGNWAPGDTYLIYPNGEPSQRFMWLHAGIVAAEKARILLESGVLKAEDLEKFSKRYNIHAAMQGSLNLENCRKDFEAIVNK